MCVVVMPDTSATKRSQKQIQIQTQTKAPTQTPLSLLTKTKSTTPLTVLLASLLVQSCLTASSFWLSFALKAIANRLPVLILPPQLLWQQLRLTFDFASFSLALFFDFWNYFVSLYATTLPFRIKLIRCCFPCWCCCIGSY